MQGQAMLTFPKSIVADLIRFIDTAFRTLPDRDNRAIAGLSMGGGMTLLAAFNNLDKFAWVGTFSAGLPPMPGVAVPINPPLPNAASLRGPDINNTIDKQKLAALLPQLDASANAKLRPYYVGMSRGRTDHRAQHLQGTFEGEGRQCHYCRNARLWARVGILAHRPSRLCAKVV
jgi:enterochelin esterase-like enzyme